MSDKQKAILAWILFGMIVVSTSVQMMFKLANEAGETAAIELLSDAAWSMVIPIVFGFVGSLIISRQPRNAIGVLLLLPAVLAALPLEPYIGQFSEAPAEPSPLLLGLLWFSGWSWLLLIMPVLFILVLFPTGKPLTPRWRWLIYWGLGMSAAFLLLGLFEEQWVAGEGGWAISNPIGFLPAQFWDDYVALPWFTLLPLLTLSCLAALLVRYRRSRNVQREQVKWLFYAGGLFAVFYATSFIDNSLSDSVIWQILLVLILALIPLAIGAAILRFRLYDIDIIIRRTLVYGLLTAVLLAIYFGVVLVAQSVFVALTGQESPIAIVISTLLIAALFNPLRRWLQDAIDRRFYRRSYDAGLALAQFAQSARDEVEMDKLEADLLQVITETMQPQMLSVWLAGEGPAALETPAK